MRRIISIVTIFIAILLFTSVFIVSGQTNPDNNTTLPPKRIFTTNNNQGIINNETLFVFGPNICTSYGDPYSPGESLYNTQHPYTYNFSIVIPPDYADDVLRVELFDPDSFNQFAVEDDVSYSNTAIANGFPATPKTEPCYREYQTDACIINTTEYTLTETIPGIEMNQVNPLWLVRVDENRGNGTFACTGSATYLPQHNTATLYALSYDRQHVNGLTQPVQLASYTGQVYDNQRDTGDHLTDLHWVSPGGTLSSDQPAFVPVDSNTPINPATGAPYTFEINIARDLPNIVVDPVTGDRIVHLDVTSLSGGSKNSFAVWAGPNDDVAIVPGEANARNLFQVNNPGVAYTQGVQILADKTFPLQSMFHEMDIPLMYLGPEYAGQTTRITIFDLDSTSVPPINFYIDTLAYKADDSENGYDETQTDWVVAHGFPGDPEGGCFTLPYDTQHCNDQFVSYDITLPSELECSSPDSCMPFYGGYLRANFPSDSPVDAYDGSAWEIDEPTLLTSWDNTQGCSAFPIAVDENIRSVDINRWRTDFEYPIPAPDYYQFINHTPDVPLLSAKPGDLFNIQNGSSAGGKGWLAWNQCNAADSSALETSLTWPGNSKDYSPRPGRCTINGESMGRFAGFMEFGDNSDKSMHTGDWVALSTGNVNSNGIRDTLEGHVDLERILRVIVSDDVTGSGGDAANRISRFALMRIIGYSISSSDSFMMAEFIGWDDSCGQGDQPLPTGGNGPGGVGRTDGTTDLELWLQADEDALTAEACTPGTDANATETVACWGDQSGKGHNATETTNGPALLTAVSNNQPALHFSGTNYLDNTLDLNGRSGFTFFEVAGAASESGYQSILRFQDAVDSAIVYPDANQLSLSSDTSINAGFVTGGLNIGTAVYQLNTSDGMKTYHDGTLVASANTGTTPLPADSLTIGRNNATQADYTNAGVAELIVFDRELSLVERILVENYLSAKYAQPIANDKFDGDDSANDDFDMDVAGIGREADSLHTIAASSGMTVTNISFLRDPGDYLLFGHRTATNDNSITQLPEGGDWDGAPEPQRWTRYWYIDVTDMGPSTGGSVQIIFDLSDAGMQGLPNGPASNYRLLKREGIDDVFTDIATAVSIEGDRIIFDGVDVALLGSNFTLGTLDAQNSPTAVMLETAIAQTTAPTLLIILILIALLSFPTFFLIRRKNA